MFKIAIPKKTSVAEATLYNKPTLLFLMIMLLLQDLIFKFVDELIERHETSSLMFLVGFQNFDFLDDEFSNERKLFF